MFKIKRICSVYLKKTSKLHCFHYVRILTSNWEKIIQSLIVKQNSDLVIYFCNNAFNKDLKQFC